MMTSNTHAPAIAARLEAARAARAVLDPDFDRAVLEAAEGVRGADKRLAELRARVDAADREVAELERALVLGERLDREAIAAAAAKMRAEQLAAFKSAMSARERAMGDLLEAAAAMATAFAAYGQATLTAQTAIPFGTSAPPIAMGQLGTMGPAFGSGEALILAELWRVAPERKDGRGRWAVPFAKPPSPIQRNYRKQAPAIMEFTSANTAIVRSVEEQVAALDEKQMAAATADSTKDAA
ncbi:hypothetical protein [Bradyrhizobium sp. STM 3557]|uniref:hypothetical protein n=1 Tax=Bradyrhizobium sp. STM 3557 TaxID=578920 RepID=UPI00388F303C